ncbi:MAG: hypothetical protein ACRYFY_20805 [Janthinobacterium lividum]
MKAIEVCDDCAATIAAWEDPPDRPGRLDLIKAHWPDHDLLRRDDEDDQHEANEVSDDPQGDADPPLL